MQKKEWYAFYQPFIWAGWPQVWKKDEQCLLWETGKAILIFWPLLQAVTTTIVCYASPLVLASLSEYQSEGWGKICNLTFAIACTFIISTLTYGCKYPERLAPGKFDLIGTSCTSLLAQSYLALLKEFSSLKLLQFQVLPLYRLAWSVFMPSSSPLSSKGIHGGVADRSTSG